MDKVKMPFTQKEAGEAMDKLKVGLGNAKHNISKMVDIVTQKSLTNMVKGIRNASSNQDEYIAKCMQEIKAELRESNPHVKANGIRKLIYLHMIGYDMNWAAFHVVELMSAPWFAHRRLGYLAASLCFTQNTDVILLTTHLFRKSFTQNSTQNADAYKDGQKYEIGSALSCLANIVTPDLGEQIIKDIYGMMNSSQPYVRKKSTLLLLKIFKRWPKGLRLSFDRLKEKLDDDHPGVVSAAVYVICELASKNPKNYLALAPDFFKILTNSSNNWVLIKVAKLLGSLVPLEPRLAKKIQEPLADIITTTPAKSLMYECINTLLKGQLTSKSTVRLCLDKLRTFIEDPDQNLKYLGLLGLHKLMQKHPRVVAEHKDLILDCLNDEDVSIRTRALDLITSMVSKRNLVGIVKRLIQHLDDSDGSYRNHVFERIIFICSQEHYSYLTDFGWYVGVLVDLTHVTGCSVENAQRLDGQLMDVAVRVEATRKYVVRCMMEIILSGRLLSESQNSLMAGMSEVLSSASYIVGEFSHFAKHHGQLIAALLKPQVNNLPQNVQVMFIQNVLKLFIAATRLPFDIHKQELTLPAQSDDESSSDSDSDDDRKRRIKSYGQEDGVLSYPAWQRNVQTCAKHMTDRLPEFTHSHFVEVQERAVVVLKFVEWILSPNGPGLFLNQTPSDDVEESTNTVLAQSPMPTQTETKEADFLGGLLDNVTFTEPSSQLETKGESAAEPIGNGEDDNGPVKLDIFGPDDTAQEESTRAVSNTDVVSVNVDDPELQDKMDRLQRVIAQLSQLCSEPLVPVHPLAQANVAVPSGLDLDEWIIPQSESEDEMEEPDYLDDMTSSSDEDDRRSKKKRKKDKEKRMKAKKAAAAAAKKDSGGYGEDSGGSFSVKAKTRAEVAEAKARRAALEEQRKADPFYIPSTSMSRDDLDDIPMEKLDLEIDLEVSVKKKKKKDKKKKKSRRSDIYLSDDDQPPKVYTVMKDAALPEGVDLSAQQEDTKEDSEHDDMDQDLEGPLGKDEKFFEPQSYAMMHAADEDESLEVSNKKKKKDKKKKKERQPIEDAGDLLTPDEPIQAPSPAPEAKSSSSGNPLVQTLVDNDRVNVTCLPRLKLDGEQASVHVRILAKSNKDSKKYKAKASFELPKRGFTFEDASPGKVGSDGKKASLAFKKVRADEPAAADLTLSLNGKTPSLPIVLKTEFSYQDSKGKGSKDKVVLSIPLSALIEPSQGATKADVAAFADKCASNAEQKLTLNPSKFNVGQSLKVTSLALHVALVEAANMIAWYSGTLQVDGSQVVVKVAASKSDQSSIQVTIWNQTETYCTTLLKELEGILC